MRHGSCSPQTRRAATAPHSAVSELEVVRRFSRAMLKKTLFTLAWTALFFFGALALLLGGFFIAGLYSDQPSITFSQLWRFTPWIGAAIGFVLGLRGRLPGTYAHPR